MSPAGPQRETGLVSTVSTKGITTTTSPLQLVYRAQQHNVVISSSNMATYDFCCYGDFLKAIYLILKYDLPHTTNICT